MSNQIVITSGAKVRNLDGVLTGTAGIVGSVGFGTANGVATLDSTGKVPLSQLPASIITYLGTWNALTNTPTLVNGVGDVGDLYICNVAGTANFGAGPIIFAVGDWVIYNGSEWQKSAGTNGTVTSVAMTVPTGLSVSGSPITTAGTLDVSLASGYTIPTTSFLSGLVPYTGATQTVDLGAYDLNARGIKINGTGGLGHADFKHQSGTPTGSASSSTLYADTNGDIAWLNDHSHTITLASNANTADRTYTFPNASGTLALTSDISYPVTSVFGRTGAVTAQSGDYTTTQVTEGTNLYFTDARARGAISLTTSGSSGAATYNSTTGVLNVPNYGSALSGYVPYTGATAQVDLGSNNLYGKSLNVWGDGTNGGGLNLKQYTSQSFLPGYGYTAVFTDSSYGFGIWFLNGASTGRQINFNASLLANNTGQTYYLPAATGTIALTSDIPSLSGYIQGSGTTNYHTKFTASGTIGNSLIYDNGTNVGVNTTSLTLKFNVAGDTYSSQGFFVQNSTDTFIGSLNNTSGMVVNGTTLATVIRSGGNNVLTLASSGAATFSSSVTATQGIFTDSGTSSNSNIISLLQPNFASTFGPFLSIGVANSTNNSGALQFNYVSAGSNSNTINLSLYGKSGLSINGSGAATFSSSVTAANAILSATTGYTFYQINNTAGTVYIGTDNSAGAVFGQGNYSMNIYQGYSGDMNFFTTAALRMKITSSGNVGIGTSSPSNILHAYSSLPRIISDTSSQYAVFNLYAAGSEKGAFYLDNTAKTIILESNGDNTYPLLFRTGGSERMRITSGGEVCVNRTSGSGKFNIDGTFYMYNMSTGAGNSTLKYNTSTGLVTNDSSARIFKKDITDLEYGLETILKMSPKKYKWKSDNSNDLGFIADEMFEIIPEIVSLANNNINKTELKDGEPMGINYDRLVPVLVKAIQELSAKVTALENKI